MYIYSVKSVYDHDNGKDAEKGHLCTYIQIHTNVHKFGYMRQKLTATWNTLLLTSSGITVTFFPLLHHHF